MARKLVLTNPGDQLRVNTRGIRAFALPPPSLAYLAALTPSHWEPRIVDENIEDRPVEEADLVGITAMTSSAPRACEISEEYSRRGIKPGNRKKSGLEVGGSQPPDVPSAIGYDARTPPVSRLVVARPPTSGSVAFTVWHPRVRMCLRHIHQATPFVRRSIQLGMNKWRC